MEWVQVRRKFLTKQHQEQTEQYSVIGWKKPNSWVGVELDLYASWSWLRVKRYTEVMVSFIPWFRGKQFNVSSVQRGEKKKYMRTCVNMLDVFPLTYPTMAKQRQHTNPAKTISLILDHFLKQTLFVCFCFYCLLNATLKNTLSVLFLMSFYAPVKHFGLPCVGIVLCFVISLLW